MKKIFDKTFLKFCLVGIAKPLAGVVLNNASKTIQENGAMLVGMGLFVILN